GNLWTTSGTLLATATFTNESASGWQIVTFATPIAVTANTLYVASYYAPLGHYVATSAYFASTGQDTAMLHAPASGTLGNGVYRYGASGFPTGTYNAANYWVDVVFTTGSNGTPAQTFVDTTVADFSRGSLDASTYVAASGDGELILQPVVGAEFSGSTVPSGWTMASWGVGTPSTVIGGGAAAVD